MDGIGNGNIGLNDTNIVLNGIEQLALLVGVLTVAYIVLHKKGLIPAKLKTVLMVAVGVWALVIMLQYAISVYDYAHYTRPMEQELQHQNPGL